MLHNKISAAESHPDYPSIIQSNCGNWRVIRCPDDLQWIVQQYRSPKWRNKSYHREWWSIEERYANIKVLNLWELPDGKRKRDEHMVYLCS